MIIYVITKNIRTSRRRYVIPNILSMNVLLIITKIIPKIQAVIIKIGHNMKYVKPPVIILLFLLITFFLSSFLLRYQQEPYTATGKIEKDIARKKNISIMLQIRPPRPARISAPTGCPTKRKRITPKYNTKINPNKTFFNKIFLFILLDILMEFKNHFKFPLHSPTISISSPPTEVVLSLIFTGTESLIADPEIIASPLESDGRSLTTSSVTLSTD